MEAIRIPSLAKVFVTDDGRSIKLSLIDAIEKAGEILEEYEGKRTFEHLQKFSAWVKSVSGVDVTRDEADWLIDHVYEEYQREKKLRRPSLTLLPSTPELTPDE